MLRSVAQDLEAWRIESAAGDGDLVFAEPGKPWTLSWGNWKEWRTRTYAPLARMAVVEGSAAHRPGFGGLQAIDRSRCLPVEVDAFMGSAAQSPDLFGGGFAAACDAAESEIMAARLAQGG